MNSLMKYNGLNGELVCYAPADEEVLRVVGIGITDAHKISNAIQEAYNTGWSLGRYNLKDEIGRIV